MRRGVFGARYSGSTIPGGTRMRNTSVGISTYTGPGGLPSPIAIDHALSRSRSRLSAVRSVRALRVTGFMIETWSMPCSGPRSSCGIGAQPPISRTGARSSCALAIAVTQLVTPGPAVTSAMPTSPVSTAWQCAMCTAAPSSRTSTIRTLRWARWSQIGWMWPPWRPYTRSTPRLTTNSAIHSAAVRAGIAFMRTPPGETVAGARTLRARAQRSASFSARSKP